VAAPPTSPLHLHARKVYRILVVDDSADTADSLAHLLRRAGHTVSTAYSGPAALESVRAQAPQVVILDIGLPGLDGYEVALRLRGQADPGRPLLLIALTGWGEEGGRERATAAGFDRYLVKPVEAETLLEVIAGWRG
jgi:CheY-like chemotaxis protein